MKIAFVVHDYRRMEGHSRYVVELATRFTHSHEIHVFANQIHADENSGIHFHRIPAWRPNALFSIVSFAIAATLRVWGRFDIIHNQGLCGLRGNVFTAHICNRAWHRALRQANGGLSFHEWVSGTTLTILEYLFYRFARKSRVIAVSRRVAEDLRRLYHCTAPITVIHHGVDLSTFVPACENSDRFAIRSQYGIAGGEMVFLFVGDMRKGGRQCISALSLVPQAKLLFVSRSPDAPYRSLASRFGVGERVLFLGTQREVPKYYAASDALLLPTHYDSFGLVLTEAMASALPVIASREAGAAELIEPGINGLLLDDFRDHVELAAKMQLLTDDPKLSARLGRAARQTVESYSWDVTAAQTLQVYEEVTAATGKNLKIPSYSAQR